ncbi:helix-turn-helix domain-containing protein [Peptostreptococcus sp.]|uniref:helix-turn-helix domain-containing protein n=1 Tax=Peptostreptococcus sp. TaxID=1262 RepID=UPI003FA683E1
MLVYDNVKNLRLKNELTQLEVANSLNLSLYGYQKIERGLSDIKLSTLISICNLYNITPNELIYNNFSCSL